MAWRRIAACVGRTVQRLDDLAEELVDELERHRREALLHLPYGENAEVFGGLKDPPSHRQPEPDEGSAAA